MKILFCHEVSYLDKPVYEYQDFPERLAARGHEVEVIDFTETVRVVSGSRPVSRTGEGTVTLTGIPHGNWPFFKYFQARANFRRMLSQRLRRGDVDAVFVYSVFINGTQAVRLGRKFGVPVVYRVLDAYHRLRPGQVTRSILRRGERFIYRHADCVLVTNEQMGDYVSHIAGRDTSARRLVIDHGVDSVHFAPRAPDRELLDRYRLRPGDTVALFLGTTYAFSGLANFIRLMPEALRHHPSLKLFIVGGGQQDQELRDLVDRLDLAQSIVLTGMVGYQDVPRYLSLASVALNPFEINDITRDIVPIKILQYQAMGIPTVSTPLPDLRRKHPDGVSGVAYSDSDDPESFMATLLGLLRNIEGLTDVGRRGQDFVTRNYSVERAVSTIEATLLELVRAQRERVHA